MRGITLLFATQMFLLLFCTVVYCLLFLSFFLSSFLHSMRKNFPLDRQSSFLFSRANSLRKQYIKELFCCFLKKKNVKIEKKKEMNTVLPYLIFSSK